MHDFLEDLFLAGIMPVKGSVGEATGSTNIGDRRQLETQAAEQLFGRLLDLEFSSIAA